jgi:hypothetical protein
MVYTCISGIIFRPNIGGGVERGQYLAAFEVDVLLS